VSFLKKLAQGLWLPVIAIVAAAVILYGPYLRQLGYYLDDWPNLYFHFVQGDAGTWLFHAYDGRPLSGWFYTFLFPILGYQPLAWQVFTLGMRVLATVLLVVVLLEIWPRQKRAVTFTALLFLVYPVFIQQASALTFSAHWVAYACVFLSWYLMILAIRRPGWYWPLTLLSMLVSGVGFVLEEYFVGMELLRLPLLYLYWFNRRPAEKNYLKFILKQSAPYLLVWLGFVLWRTVFIQLPVADRNRTVVLAKWLSAPVAQTLELLRWALQDFLYMVGYAWSQAFNPALITWATPAELLAWAAAILCAGGVLLLGGVRSWRRDADDDQQAVFRSQAFWFGVLGILFGALPTWMIHQRVSNPTALWNDRYGLATMWPAALILVALAGAWIRSRRVQMGLLAAAVAFSVVFQAHVLNDYRWSWTFQQRFFAQLSWRVPSVEPNTLFLSDGEVFSKMGVYPTSFALNVLYPQPDPQQASTWFLTINKYFGDNINEFLEGKDVERAKWQAIFNGNSEHSLVLRYENTENSCLWVLSPRDLQNPMLSDLTRTALDISDLNLIGTERTPGVPPEGMFGTVSTDTWCYYYEKADLARQFGQWDQVNALWDESQSKGFGPTVNIELTPFIDAAMHTGRWQQAIDQSTTIFRTIERVGPYLCTFWEDDAVAQQIPAEYQTQYQGLLAEFKCQSGE
jgi:hypothetical protein